MPGEHLDQVERPGRVDGPAAGTRRTPDGVRSPLAGSRGPAVHVEGHDPGALPAIAGLPIVELQHAAGNAAVAGLLSARPAAAAPAPSARLVVQRALPDDYATMSDDRRMEVIRDVLARDSGGTLYLAWQGLADPLAVAKKAPDLFAASVKKNSGIADLAAFDHIRAQFQTDVLGRAREYVAVNQAALEAERSRVGVPTTGEHAGETAEADKEVQEIQKLVPEMERIKQAKADMLRIQLGYEKRGTSGTQDLYPILFEPGNVPESAAPRQMHEHVLRQWTRTIQAEAAVFKKAPSSAYFMAEGGDPSKIGPEVDIKVARAEITKAIDDLDGRMKAAMPKIGNGVNFEDLVPIQDQLLSGPIWSRPVESAVAREEIKDANIANILAALGIGALSGAAFLFASFVSGGLATVLFATGAGISGAQAGMSWDKWADLAAAHKASIDPTAQLVSGEQVDAAMISAVLDTVFAAIDVWQGAKGVQKAAEATENMAKMRRAGEAMAEGAKSGATAGTAEVLRTLRSAEKPGEALARAVAEVGPEEAQRLSGLSYDDLATIAGRESSLGQRLLLLAEKGAGALSEEAKELLADLPKIATITDADRASKVLEAGLSQFGYKGVLERVGGWAAIRDTGVMKAGSGPAAALQGWRTGIASELDDYIRGITDDISKVVPTGTQAASSDLDAQLIGGAAAELQQRAEGWLAGRMGTDVKDAKRLLDAEIFIDPSRAHFADVAKGLSPETRAKIQAEMAAVEPPLIFSARLRAAEKLGPEAVDRVLKEAEAAGIKAPFPQFTPLTPAEQADAAATIDRLMEDLAKKDLDETARAAKVKQVSMTQASINASHTDAYVGGGAAVWVTGREIDVEKLAKALNVDPDDLRKWSAAKRISAALSEGKWLDKAVAQLHAPDAGDDIAALAHAVRDIGKHGSRAADVLRVPGSTNVARLENLMGTLVMYKEMTPADLARIVTSGDLAMMRGEIDQILGALSTETGNAVGKLRSDAAAAGVELVGNPDYDALTAWRGRYVELTTGARTASEAQIRALETAVDTAKQSSDQRPPEPGVYPTPAPESRPPETTEPQESRMPLPGEEPQESRAP